MKLRGRRPRPRRGILGFVAGALAGSLALGGTAAWGYWSAAATATGAAQTPKVAVSQLNFASNTHTFTNTTSSLTTTGSFTVTNTGEVAGAVSVSLASSDALAAQMPLSVWPVPAASACTAAATVPSVAASGSWKSVTLALGGTLGSAASQAFCLRTQVPDRQSLATAAGSASFDATLTASLAAGGWTATASTGKAEQATSRIYPLATAYLVNADSRWYRLATGSGSPCLSLPDGAGASDAGLRSSACASTPGTHQVWQVLPVSEQDQSLVTLRPRSAPATRITVGADGVLSNAVASTGTGQQFRVQRIDDTHVQLVSPPSGLCLPVPAAGNGGLSLVDCTAADTTILMTRVPITVTNVLGLASLVHFGAVTTSGDVGLATQYQKADGTWATIPLQLTTGGADATLLLSGVLATTNVAYPVRVVFANDPDGNLPVPRWGTAFSGLTVTASGVLGLGLIAIVTVPQ